MASTRNLGLMGLLTLTLAATWYAAGLDAPEDDLLATPADPGAAEASRPAASVATDARGAGMAQASPTDALTPAQAPAGVRMSAGTRDLFGVRSWQPPPPPAAAPVAAPAPRAPVLPFRYIGRMEEEGRVAVFVSDGALTKVLRQGDTWTNYRVDEITAQGMRLTYTPLNETQRMLFESPN